MPEREPFVADRIQWDQNQISKVKRLEFSVLHPVHILTPFLKYEYLKSP